jgi:hypothetical protein
MKNNCAKCHFLKCVNGNPLERSDRASVIYKRSGWDSIIKQLTCHKEVWKLNRLDHKNFEELTNRIYKNICFHFRKHKEGISLRAMEEIQSNKSINNKFKVSIGFNLLLLAVAAVELLIILKVIVLPF